VIEVKFKKNLKVPISARMLQVVSVLILSVVLALQGCMENPTSVGLGFLQSGDIPKIDTLVLYASTSSTIPAQINTSLSDRLLLGKYAGYDALTIVRFTGLPVGILDTVSIVDAHIDLRSVYHFGDSLAAIAFQGYQAVSLVDSVQYDSLSLFPNTYYSPTPISVVPPFILDDTSTVRCPLDTSLVRTWFTTDGSLSNYGVVFKATNVNTIKGFASFGNANTDYWPKLTIDYVSSNGSGSLTYSSGVSLYAASIPQSTLLAMDPQLMYVQSGVAYRGQLNFNLTNLPKPALVLKADLQLTLAPSQSNLNSYVADTILAYYIKDDSTIAGGYIPSAVTIVSANGVSSKVYTFAVAPYVRPWSGGAQLQRLQFGGLRESSSLDLFALYGTESPLAVRPRLIITSIIQ
jgi:hypothetical protein